MSELKVFHSEKNVLLSTWRNVSIGIWSPDPSVAVLQKSREHSLALRKEYPQGYVTFSITPQLGIKMARLGAEQRKLVGEMFLEFRDVTKASVSVLEGSGFWLSAARAVMTGIALMNPTPTKIFDTSDAGVDWLLTSGHIPNDPEAFRSATAEARAAWEAATSG